MVVESHYAERGKSHEPEWWQQAAEAAKQDIEGVAVLERVRHEAAGDEEHDRQRGDEVGDPGGAVCMPDDDAQDRDRADSIQEEVAVADALPSLP